MMHPNPYLTMMGALNFDALDLYANRRGELSERQKHLLQKQALERARTWVVILLLAMIVSWLANARLVVAGLVVVLMVALVSGVQRLHADLTGRVQRMHGRLSVVRRVRLLPFGLHHYVLVNDECFRVSQQMQRAFEQGSRYRVFYAPASRVILAAERV